jgi:hypothetical protein
MVTGWRTLLLAPTCVSQAIAQTSSGVNVAVVDSTGALIPDTRITATNLDSGASRKTITNETSAYEFPLLQPGRYSLVARKEGFRQVTREGIQLELNQVANSATVDQFSVTPARVQDGLPPIPRVDAASLINNPSGNFNVVPPNYKTGYAQQGTSESSKRSPNAEWS